MNFLDGALFPENQEKLVITAAPYGPEWIPSRLSGGHRGFDGGSGAEGGRLLQRRRHRAARARPRGRRQGHRSGCRSSTSCWPAARRGARHGAAGGRLDLLRPGDGRRRRPSGCRTTRATCWPTSSPKPDQVTVTVNTSQMNVVEQMEPADIAGTSLSEPEFYNAYREMVVPGGPGLGRGARASASAPRASRAHSSSTTSTASRPSSA